jgi:hypothetical protein
LVLSPLVHNFGAQALREMSQPVTLKLTNQMADPVLVERMSLAGAATSFVLDAAECETELAPGQSCDIQVNFYPQSAGLKTAQVNVYDADGNRYQVGLLEGTGAVGSLAVSETQVDFTDLRKGEAQTKTITLTNVGTGPAYNLNISYSGDPALSFNSGCSDLQPQQSCTIAVTALVNDDTAKRGTLTVLSSNTLTQTLRIQVSATAAALYPGENPANESPLEVTPTNCEWSGIYLYAVSSCQAEIKNTASAPIRFLGGFVTNEAFSASTTACPRDLAPGQSCSVTVTFNPRKLGTHEGSLHLIAENHDRKTITLKGTAIPLPVSLSASQVDFGTVNLLMGAYKTLTLTGADGSGAAHLVVGAPVSKNFQFSPACPTYLPRGQSCLVGIQTKGSAQLGDALEEYFFNVNGQRIMIPVKARFVADQLEPSARQLTFESAYVGLSQRKTLSLLNLGGTNINLASISSTSGSFTLTHNCAATLAPGASCNIAVDFSPDTYGNFNGNLQIVYGSPVQVLSIPLQGTGLAGSLEPDSRQLDFGELMLASSASREVTLTNTSPVPVFDVGVSVTDSRFSVENRCSPEVAPGASCKLVVSVAATSFGHYEAGLQLSWRGKPSGVNGTRGDIELQAVVPGARLESSASAFNFGEVPVGESKTLAVRILNASDQPTLLSNPIVEGDHSYSSEWSVVHNCAMLNPGDTCDVALTYQPSRYRLVSGTRLAIPHSAGADLRININAIGADTDVRFFSETSPWYYAIAPDTRTTQEGRAPTGSLFEVSMPLRNFGTITASGITYELSDNVERLSSACETIAAATNCVTKVVLKTAVVGDQTAVVKAMHKGRTLTQTFNYRVGGPKIEISSGSLDFGSVFLGQNKSLAVELFNAGDDIAETVVIDNWAYNESPWFVSHNCLKLSPGDRCQAQIRFAPSRNCDFYRSVSIRAAEQKAVDAAYLLVSGKGISDTLRLSSQPRASWAQAIAEGLRMTVVNTGNVPAQISSITSQDGRVELGTCSLTEPLQPATSCQYLLFPSQTPATDTVVLKSLLRTSRNIEYVGNHGLATNNLYWDNLPSGVLDFGPTAVNPADTARSQSKVRQVVLRSAGDVPFEADVTFELDGGYSVAPAPGQGTNLTCSANTCTLKNQGVYTFNIYYRPQNMGSHSGRLTVTPRGHYADSTVPDLVVVGQGVYDVQPLNPLPEVDFGATSFDTASGVGLQVERTITISTSGRFGSLQGHWELSDTTHFRFGSATMTCAASTSGRTGFCESAQATGSSLNLSVSATVLYRPTALGQHEVTLRFVPAGETGLAPVSVTLRGESLYEYTPRLVRLLQQTAIPAVVDEGKFHYDPYGVAGASSHTLSLVVLPFDKKGNVYAGAGRVTGRFELAGSNAARLKKFQVFERYNEIGGCAGFDGYNSFYSSKAYRCEFNDRTSLNCTADFIGEGGVYSFGQAACRASYHFESLRADVEFANNFLGKQEVTVTYRAADQDTVLSTTIQREGMFDAQYAMSSRPDTTALPTAAQRNFGVAAVNQAVDGTNESITRSFFIRNTGQWGAIAGDIIIDQSPAFRLERAELVNDSGTVLGTCNPDATGMRIPCVAQHGGQGGGRHIRLSVTFQPNVPGMHYSRVTFVPHEVLQQQPSVLELQGEGVYNVGYATSLSLTGEITPPEVFDVGKASYNKDVLGTSQTKTATTLYILNTGTAGKLAGSMTIGGPGAASFNLVEWGKIAPNGAKSPCSAGTMCSADSASDSPSVKDNLYAVVTYTPQVKGLAEATLTFTPTDATGLPSQSWTLRGEGAYDADARWRADLQATQDQSQHEFFTELGYGALVTYTLKNTGKHGQLTGFVQLTGSPNLTLYAVHYVRDDGSKVGSCSLSNSFASALCRAGDAADPLAAKHIQVDVLHYPGAGSVVGEVNTATLSFLPHSGMGTAQQSLNITATFVNEAVGQWSAQSGTQSAPDTNFAVDYPASMVKRYFLRFNNQPGLGVARFVLTGDTAHFNILQAGYQVSTGDWGVCRRSINFYDHYSGYAQVVDASGDATFDCWAVYPQGYVLGIFVDIEYKPTAAARHTVQLRAIGSQGTTVPEPLTLTAGTDFTQGDAMTWNPQLSMAGVRFSNAESTAVFPSALLTALGPALPTSGKVYWETEFLSGLYVGAGVGTAPGYAHIGHSTYPVSCGMFNHQSNILGGSGTTVVNTGNGTGAVLGFAYDAGQRRLDIYRGGVHEGYCIISGAQPLFIAASQGSSAYPGGEVLLRKPNQLSFQPPSGYTAYGTAQAPLPARYALVYGSVSEGGTLTLNAPAGTTFKHVSFASYGTPTGTAPQWLKSSCHATASESVVAAAFLGKSSGSLAAHNSNFGDPCYGTPKRLYVVLLAQP